ncbi:MAG: SPOR domain-containing protein [Betaproteobacteria bacterium]|nr:SPOR domain-containing protein [Betaproteobacteria bacterium]
MLRNLVLLVLLANALLWAAHAGWLGGRDEGREPERMGAQINPEAIRLQPPGTAVAPASAASAPAQPASAAAATAAAPTLLCLQSAGNPATRAAALQDAAQAAAPNAQVSLQDEPAPTRWRVAMGPYANGDALNRKLDELRQLKLGGDINRITDQAALQPGVSLGVFRERTRADARLGELQKKGVKNARVVQVPATASLATLRVQGLDAALRPRLAAALQQASAQPLADCSGAI